MKAAGSQDPAYQWHLEWLCPQLFSSTPPSPKSSILVERQGTVPRPGGWPMDNTQPEERIQQNPAVMTVLRVSTGTGQYQVAASKGTSQGCGFGDPPSTPSCSKIAIPFGSYPQQDTSPARGHLGAKKPALSTAPQT